MKRTTIAQYGSWQSPVSPELASSIPAYLYETSVDSKGNVYFVEPREKENGRLVIVHLGNDGHAEAILPAGFDARTRVHEYGGGSYVVVGDTIYFANFSDRGIYGLEVSGKTAGKPHLVVREPDVYYADMAYDRMRRRIICIREDHSAKGREPSNTIAAVETREPGAVKVLVSGNDFYSSPRLSPDGKRLAWLTWNHPGMPFFGTELWTGEILGDGTVGRQQKVSGGPSESVCEPRWSPDGMLHFVSDRSGWWNLYRFDGIRAECLHETDAEFTRPQWVLGMSSWAFAASDLIVCTFTRNGVWHLGVLDTRTRSMREIVSPYTEFSYLSATDGCAVFVAGSPRTRLAIVRLDVSSGEFRTVYPNGELQPIPEGCLSMPEHIDFPTSGGRMAHGFFYTPKNDDYKAAGDELPPLLIVSHGGPTSAARSLLNPDIQYWTSRGFAVLDVNYGGSTGYGRDYRMRLNGLWGIVDVDDCVNGALFLAGKRRVHARRLIIRGRSAGGYTTLAALAFRNTFAAGASYFGVSDLELLVRDTHKFESRYLETLIGPYPEKKELYAERSPINGAHNISAPVIFFQGLEDRVVPPDQAEHMFDLLRKKGVPTAYLAFEGEQHGFRRAENIRRAYEAELYFYSRALGFDAGGSAVPVSIENMQ